MYLHFIFILRFITYVILVFVKLFHIVSCKCKKSTYIDGCPARTVWFYMSLRPDDIITINDFSKSELTSISYWKGNVILKGKQCNVIQFIFHPLFLRLNIAVFFFSFQFPASWNYLVFLREKEYHLFTKFQFSIRLNKSIENYKFSHLFTEKGEKFTVSEILECDWFCLNKTMAGVYKLQYFLLWLLITCGIRIHIMLLIVILLPCVRP